MSTPPAKKAKPAYTFNVNKALDKAFETKSFKDVVSEHPSALQGLADRADDLLKEFHITTIEQLANWKHARIARAIVALAEEEEEGKRDAKSDMNINKAVVKAFETKSLTEIADSPVSALQGLTDRHDKALAKLHVKSVRGLADWKYVKWAQGLVTLAEFESPDHTS